jgi:hypothetical protein
MQSDGIEYSFNFHDAPDRRIENPLDNYRAVKPTKHGRRAEKRRAFRRFASWCCHLSDGKREFNYWSLVHNQIFAAVDPGALRNPIAKPD